MNAISAITKLESKGIGCRPFFCPMNQQPVLNNMGLFCGESYPVAERMYKQGFYIPSGMALTSDQIKLVADALWEVFG